MRNRDKKIFRGGTISYLDPCEDVWRQWRTLGPSVLSRVQNHLSKQTIYFGSKTKYCSHRLQVWQMDEALCVWLGVHVHVVDDVEAVGNVDLPLLGVVLHLLLLLPGVGRGKRKLAGCFGKRLLVGGDLETRF